MKLVSTAAEYVFAFEVRRNDAQVMNEENRIPTICLGLGKKTNMLA